MSDIVERLRDDPQRNFSEAIDEIGRLRTNYDLLADDYRQLLGDNERLRDQNEHMSVAIVNSGSMQFAYKQEQEVERLRGLLREAYLAKVYVVPTWLSRVREALGHE